MRVWERMPATCHAPRNGSRNPDLATDWAGFFSQTVSRVLGRTGGWPAHLGSFLRVPITAIVRARLERRRKARVEKILRRIGVTPTQAVNLLYAEIERQKAIPFPIALGEDNSDLLPPIEHVAQVWNELDRPAD